MEVKATLQALYVSPLIMCGRTYRYAISKALCPTFMPLKYDDGVMIILLSLSAGDRTSRLSARRCAVSNLWSPGAIDASKP